MEMMDLLQYVFAILATLSTWGAGGFVAARRMRVTSGDLTADTIRKIALKNQEIGKYGIVGAMVAVGVTVAMGWVWPAAISLGGFVFFFSLMNTSKFFDGNGTTEQLVRYVELAKVRVTTLMVIPGVLASLLGAWLYFM